MWTSHILPGASQHAEDAIDPGSLSIGTAAPSLVHALDFGHQQKTGTSGVFPAKTRYSQNAMRNRPPPGRGLLGLGLVTLHKTRLWPNPPGTPSRGYSGFWFLPVFGRSLPGFGRCLATIGSPSPGYSPGLLADTAGNASTRQSQPRARRRKHLVHEYGGDE